MSLSDVGILWWCAPLVIAAVAAAGISLSRHYKKGEWDVVEDFDETG